MFPAEKQKIDVSSGSVREAAECQGEIRQQAPKIY